MVLATWTHSFRLLFYESHWIYQFSNVTKLINISWSLSSSYNFRCCPFHLWQHILSSLAFRIHNVNADVSASRHLVGSRPADLLRLTACHHASLFVHLLTHSPATCPDYRNLFLITSYVMFLMWLRRRRCFNSPRW